MAITSYPVPPNFPNGLNLGTLPAEMRAVWPADLHASVYSHTGGPQGAATGILTIETPRAITAPENAAALAHFQTHAGGTSHDALVLVDLPPPGERVGSMVYVADAPRSGAPALGCVLYSDGANWRRVSDDGIIA